MEGYVTNYVNLITDNLRDRYDNGFPIIKELIQNADDSGANRFVFGLHKGLSNTDHPLLKGPGLWFFNNGRFKGTDRQALRSFGINSKAGDDSVIGKFGLGMKSVFHLCEALFYVASEEEKIFREGLTPWKYDGHNIHPEWEDVSSKDWGALEKVATETALNHESSWFLLWLPLRKKTHLFNTSGEEVGAIISRFPGDDPFRELGFLDDDRLQDDIASILPLLKHLKQIECISESQPFSLALEVYPRLMEGNPPVESSGRVTDQGNNEVLSFFGVRQTANRDDSWFETVKKRSEWPKSRFRDELGHERIAPDKSTAEGAILIYSGRPNRSESRISWAVFLPLEAGAEKLVIKSRNYSHSIVLHGQFFVDAGRRGIHSSQLLSRDIHDLSTDRLDESVLNKVWNQRLTQTVVMPLVLPALDQYIKHLRLPDNECEDLTWAFKNSGIFQEYKKFICGDHFWVKRLRNDESRSKWELCDSRDLHRLRLMPLTPESSPDRPWETFPELRSLEITPIETDAPHLLEGTPQWNETELKLLLSNLPGVFMNPQIMDYLEQFLEGSVQPFLNTIAVQSALIKEFRRRLSNSRHSNRLAIKTKAKRLFGYINPQRRVMLSAELPDSVLTRIWQQDTSALIIPKGFQADPSDQSEIEGSDFLAWLFVLDSVLDDAEMQEATDSILVAMQGLLKLMPPDKRSHLIRANANLRVLGVRDARTAKVKALSMSDIGRIRGTGTIFGFGQGLPGKNLGYSPLLADVLPRAEVFLVKREIYQELFPDSPAIYPSDMGMAILQAIGNKSVTILGAQQTRKKLLDEVNNPRHSETAKKGMRLLLHGDLNHRDDMDSKLWIGSRGQHPVWTKLWAATHPEQNWCLIDSELADTVPHGHLTDLNVIDIDGSNLLNEIQKEDIDVQNPDKFSLEERNEILSKVDGVDLWKRLPFHTSNTGSVVSASGDHVFVVNKDDVGVDSFSEGATLIRRSEHPIVGAQQDKWLRQFDDVARIEIMLLVDNPSLHCFQILDILDRVDLEEAVNIVGSLQGQQWLPTIFEQAVRPRDVIDLGASINLDLQELGRKHRQQLGNRFATPEEIRPEIRDHPAWAKVCGRLLSDGDEGLIKLGRSLSEIDEYHLGDWDHQPTAGELELLSLYQPLPGWQLASSLVGGDIDVVNVWNFVGRKLAIPLTVERLINVCDWLSSSNSDWMLRKQVFDIYLKDLSSHRDSISGHIAEFKLASSAQRWESAGHLCNGAHGVDPSYVLDETQASLLSELIYQASERRMEVECETSSELLFETMKSATPGLLKDYFEKWDATLLPRGTIGVLLGLLGRDLHPLASDFLSPHSFEWLEGKLPWEIPQGTRENPEWMSGKPIQDAFQLIEAGVHFVSERDVDVVNLLGNKIKVPLKETLSDLLAGALNWQGGYQVLIPFRRIDPYGLQPDQAESLVRRTAETLYRELYNQKGFGFDVLWKEFSQTDQLEIRIARRLILDHIPFYLRQLSVKSDWISQQLQECDTKRRRIAELEGEDFNVDLRRARLDLSQALEALATGIDERECDAVAVTAAVKGKLRQYQYDLSSVPLELFQNADDAVIELGQIRAFPDPGYDIPPGANQFVVTIDDEKIRFMHWGRPINDRGPSIFEGDKRGYARDLEKMLVLSASDKQGDDGITGKFGLGFKSVLLACDEPRVISGRLALRISAGILPLPWEQAGRAREALVKYCSNPRLMGTLIELPVVSKKDKLAMFKLFEQVAGILCVFSRSIRNVSLEGEKRRIWQWEPKQILPNIEVGLLKLHETKSKLAICIRGSTGSLLITVGPDGFLPLSKEVPGLWVTAPTRESAQIGFAVNGSYELDVGRGRLAGNFDINLAISKKIGEEVGDTLQDLLVRSRDDWKGLSETLGISDLLTQLEFWESIWVGLTKKIPKQGSRDAVQLLGQVALSALARLSETSHAIPNGLKQGLDGFTDVGNIKYSLAEKLCNAEVLRALSSWGRFFETYSADFLVSEQISKALELSGIANPIEFGVPALIALLQDKQVDPSDARFFSSLYLSTEELWGDKDVTERLDELRFLSEAGMWELPSKLLTRKPKYPDELRRYELAPSQYRLHTDYEQGNDADLSGIDFFLICRDELEAPSKLMAQWIIESEVLDLRRKSLDYIADGELADTVANLVRGKGWLEHALYDEELTQGLTDRQKDSLRRRLVSAMNLEQAVSLNSYHQEQEFTATIDFSIALQKIAQWWSVNQAEKAAKYRNQMFPWVLQLGFDSETGVYNQRDWFTLFSVGAFQGMGRTSEGQHRSFVELCEQKGWWGIFVETDPKEYPEEWMRIIESYAESQLEDEEWMLWIGQFPKMYRLRRWLNDYVDLFLSMDRFYDDFALEQLLAPRANPHFQGGGVDAPPLKRTLKIGSHIVVRELLNQGVITSELAVPHAFAPIERIKLFFHAFGRDVQTSNDIYDVLVKELGEQAAKFGGDYDIPLRMVVSDVSLQQELFN